MQPDVPTIIEQLELRVLVERDEDYGVYLATCIDTGAVATGETIEEAESLIRAVLENDFRIAMERESLDSLFHAEAPWDAKVHWYEAKAADPGSVKKIRLEVAPGAERRSVQSELRIIGRSRKGISAA
jgi:predicted RNase H-like HicB family nuclease